MSYLPCHSHRQRAARCDNIIIRMARLSFLQCRCAAARACLTYRMLEPQRSERRGASRHYAMLINATALYVIINTTSSSINWFHAARSTSRHARHHAIITLNINTRHHRVECHLPHVTREKTRVITLPSSSPCRHAPSLCRDVLHGTGLFSVTCPPR